MSQTFKLRAVLAASGRWPRRKLRRSRDVAFFAGTPVALDERIELGSDWVDFTFRGERMRAAVAEPLCYALNKPIGVVTSRRSDTEDETVFDLLDPDVARRVEPVGRLDRDTHGLLLFTEDGQLLHRLTHPKREVLRVYRVHLQSRPEPSRVDALRAAEVALADGHVPRPVFIEPDGAPTAWTIGLTEGKYHEVRRMFAAVGAPVTELQRVSYGSVELADLPDGEARSIAGEALAELYRSVALPLPEPVLHVEVVDAEA